jgi:hypothetical protein
MGAPGLVCVSLEFEPLTSRAMEAPYFSPFS